MILLDPSDKQLVTFDWSTFMSASSPVPTLSSVTHTTGESPEALTLTGEATDTAIGQSQVYVAGGTHGCTYVLNATATLSNGEIINRHVTIRCVDI